MYPPSGNFFSSAKSFGARGGFVNGLNPTLVGAVYYVSGNASVLWGPVGSDANNGLSPTTPLATMARAFALIYNTTGTQYVEQVGATIVLIGTIREQVTAPIVKNVTIVGASPQPYQGTDSGADNGAGCACWLAPTSPTASTPLLTIVEQGWVLRNIMFGTVASTPSVRFKGLETAAFPDASHAIVDGCMFATQGLTAEDGIGGYNLYNCRFTNNTFQGLSGTAIKGEDVSIRTPASNVIEGNFFRECANAINMPMNYGRIVGNFFKDVTTLQIDINAGADNFVSLNFFDKTQANISIAQGFVGNASDIWRNYSSDTAAQTVGVPS